MKKEDWLGDSTCQFFNPQETADYPFFTCIVARSIQGITVSCFDMTCIRANLWQHHHAWMYTSIQWLS
jgi:hypothetical protein